MYFLYVLKSLKDFGYYIGITDSLATRLTQRNSGKTKSTKSRLPVELVYSEQYNDKTAARKREIRLKKSYQDRKELLTKLGFNVK